MASRTIRYLIIPAGGSGKRMKSKIPKQFLILNGKPVLMHVILRFFRYDKNIRIILALPQRYITFWKRLCLRYRLAIPHLIVTGGPTRFHSVKNGLQHINDRDSLVAIHDGVRPLVSEKLIGDIYRSAEKYGSAIPVIAPGDSMRVIKRNITVPANRNSFMLVQTPQCFRSEILKKAYRVRYRNTFTDDASVVQQSGIHPHPVPGDHKNIKITTTDDIRIAEALFR